jgi:hypothetical protein
LPIVGAIKNALGSTRSKLVGLVGRVRARPRYSIAIVAGVLIGVAWIAWAIYVTSENGARAGLGVLLSWPVLLGALALIAAPFVLTAMLLQRNRASSTPAIAGAPAAPEAPTREAEQETEEKAKAAEADADPEEERTEESEAEEDPAASA